MMILLKLRQVLPSALVVLIGLSAFSVNGDQPSISVGVPRWGSNVRLPPCSLSKLPFNLRNPLNQPTELMITNRPERRGDGLIINQWIFPIGPEASVRAANLRFISSNSQGYITDLVDPETGALLQREEQVSAIQTQEVRKRIYLLNDDHEFPAFGEMARLNLLSERVQTTRSFAHEAPDYWVDYGETSIIILGRPDFASMSSAQFQAISDFVYGGGTLVFAHPATIMEAIQTPLGELLPIEPISLRRAEELPEVEQWMAPYLNNLETMSQDFFHWPQGLAMLESEVRPGTQITVSQDPFPLISWVSAGAGLVGAFGFDTTDPVFALTNQGRPLWNHVLSWSSRHALGTGGVFAEPLERVAERLTGFKAAEAGVVQMILAANLVFIILILVLARLSGRQATGWVFLGGYGLVLTVSIFFVAFQQISEQPSQSLIVLEIMNRQSSRQVGSQSISLFSQHDLSPSLKTSSGSAAFIPAVIPNIDLNPMGSFVQRPRESLQIRREGARESLYNFNLSALRRRTVGCVFSSRPLDPGQITEPAGPARLLYDDTGLKLVDFDLPADLAANTMVFLTGANGSVRLLPNGQNEWQPEPRSAIFQLDPVETRLREFIAGDWLPANRIILLYADSELPFESPFEMEDENFARIKRTLEILPVDMEISGRSITIPETMIGFFPLDRAAQTLVWQRENEYLHSGGSYIFTAHLPPSLAELHLENVVIEVHLQNPDGTASVEVELLPFSAGYPGVGEAFVIDNELRAVRGTEVRSGRFEFVTDEIENLTDPTSGRFYFRLRVGRELAPETDLPQVGQSTVWRLQDMRISVRGN